MNSTAPPLHQRRLSTRAHLIPGTPPPEFPSPPRPVPFLKTCLALLVAAQLLSLQAQLETPPRLTDLPLEALMNLEVVSAARTPRSISRTPAAIHVITSEDIERSGATSIPELLRMVPGMNVARIDANRWAVSARGFQDFFANKLLVLQDGRTLYTPLFSGVFWDVQDTILEDIERIEVVRGPGASLWGANAVNGVVNIITKRAASTHGTLLGAGSGTHETGFGYARYGGKLTPFASYRAYLKHFNRDDFALPDGSDAADEWWQSRAGFRVDWQPTFADSLTFMGSAYSGQADQRLVIFSPPLFGSAASGDTRVSGGHFLTSWDHIFSHRSDLQITTYYDRAEREDRVHRSIQDTVDVDFQHRFKLGWRQELMWGAGYRLVQDDLSDGRSRTGAVLFNENSRDDHLFTLFLQDQIILIDDLLHATAGSKLEHNDYNGYELQPTGRLFLTPTDSHTVWLAVSRAVRTPARFEHTIDAWYRPPPSKLIGNKDFHSEDMVAYELGHRWQVNPRLFLDLATFYNVYDNLRTIEPVTTSGGVRFFTPRNWMSGETYGAELSAAWRVSDQWSLQAGYSFLQMQLHARDRSNAIAPEAAEGDSPHHQLHLRTHLDLPHQLGFDTGIYYTDSLPNRDVPSYWRWDVRLSWQPRPDLQLSVAAQNVLDNQHPEFGPGFLVNPVEIERSIYAKVLWRF